MVHIIYATHGFGAPLTNSRLNIHIGTIDAKGYPNIHPTLYYFDESSNNIYVATSKQSFVTTKVIMYFLFSDTLEYQIR
jgi:hypothetical protein